MDDWHKRYGTANAEAEAARIEWALAESALARANARRHRAERIVHQLFLERITRVNAA